MKQPLTPQEEKVKAITTLIMIPVGIFIFYKISCGEETPRVEKYSKSDALVDSYEYVRAQLKSPSSADFGWDYNNAVTQIDDSTFAVHNIVDSQNGFGAMIRANYTCKIIHHSNKTTECVGLQILSR